MASSKTATLAKFGLTAALSFAGAATFLSTITGTSATFSSTVTAPTFTNSSGSFLINNTGGDFTTKTVQAASFSGTTITDAGATFLISAGNGRATTWEATTLSGATLRTTAGTVQISDALGMSGASITISPSAAAKNRILCAGTGGLIGRCTSNSATDCGCVVF